MGKLKKASAAATSVLRVPIALKFTLFIAILVVTFMTWQTYIAIGAAHEHLDREINQSGVVLVTALATLLNPDWLQDLTHQQELESALRTFTQAPGAEKQVRNIVVRNAEGRPIATARGERSYRESAGEPIQDLQAKEAGVEIREFTYEGTPARGFSRALLSPAGTRIGSLEVYISAQAIEVSRQRLSSALLGVSAAASIAAACGAFILARFLTRPIRVLLKDMKQVSLGNLQHQSKVRSSDEMGELAHTFNAMTASLLAAEEVKLAQRAVEHELSLATRIQSRLLPSAIPEVPGFEVAHYYAPAKEIGGDYYDFLRIDPDHMGVAVADVSGKGIPAALVMTMTRSLLRMAAKGETSPTRTLELVNRFLTPDMNPGMFVTILYYVLDWRAREARLARAGHNPALLFSAKHGKVLSLQPRGLAIGLDRDGTRFQAEIQVQKVPLHGGDVLITYTDGVVEAKNRDGADYSDARLESVVLAHARGSARGIADAIVADLAHHRRGVDPSDDVTLIVVKCSGS